MKMLFSKIEYNNAKTNDLLECACAVCGHNMKRTKRHVKEHYENKRNIKYCSKHCAKIDLSKTHKLNCKNCNVSFIKKNCHFKKDSNHFCSKSCSATYNNTHKTKGNRRSKLEIYVQEQLNFLYPTLEIHYNHKNTINSELDIYIPSLKLAFELSGIFHFEPIYGFEKLNQIQTNDQRKFQACAEMGISLCVIDTSSLKYFKKENAQQYLDIVIQLIKQHVKELNCPRSGN